jgi:SAM-dependent methyltransferase
MAIHYADERAVAIAEFWRVLRPGGVLVVSTQHPTTDWLRKGGSYFDVRLETDVWHMEAGELTTEPGFLILRLVKPPDPIPAILPIP